MMSDHENALAQKREQSKRWLTNAVGFLMAARLLLEAHKSGGMFHWPAFYTNLGFAYEHSLKAYLAVNGWSDEKLRLQLGHDIQKALSEATQSGLKLHSPLVGEMLEILGPSHRGNEMRYLRGEPVLTPDDPEEACRCAWDHVQSVGAQLDASSWD